jgi:hypothetical protein
MNSLEIQESIYNWALNHGFTAPYGVLMGEHTNSKGTRYLTVTFGYARTLDATVEIYNRKFMVLRTSLHGSQVFRDVANLQQTLDAL